MKTLIGAPLRPEQRHAHRAATVVGSRHRSLETPHAAPAARDPPDPERVTEMALSVDSEVGQLQEVVLHRPGLELYRLTPGNVHQLLFDDVMWAERAREEHDAFAAALRERGVTVHYFVDLLAESLDVPAGRSFLLDRVFNDYTVGPGLAEPLRELADELASPALAEMLIGGILRSDLDLPHASGMLWRTMQPGDFVLTPLPNHLFQRDNTAFAYDGLSVHPMAKQARRRESVHSRTIWNFHPRFVSENLHFYYGNDDDNHDASTVEGGDILVVGNGAVMVGLSERSTPQGISNLTRGYFSDPRSLIHTVFVVELPNERAFMHLDTAMTMIDRDAFSVYPYLPDHLRSFTLTKRGSGGDFDIQENRELFPKVAEAIGVDRIRALQAPMDDMGAQREQWDDGNNFLAVAPGVVFGYERNTTTNSFLADHGIEVVGNAGSELGRGRGGPRCMTCPISRAPA